MKDNYEENFKEGKQYGIECIKKEMSEELTRRLIETYRTKESEDYVKGQYDAFFDMQKYIKQL